MEALVLAAILVVAAQSAGTSRKTDRDFDRLMGRPRIVRTDRERTVPSGSEKGKLVRERDRASVYDPQGSLIEEVYFGFDDCTLSRHVFHYDGADTRTESVYWGNKVVDMNPNSTSAVFKQIFTFDKTGNRSEITEFDPQGKLVSRTRQEYDDKGRVRTTTDDSGSSRSQCSFTYNQIGFVEQESCRRTGGLESIEKSTYKYEADSTGNWIKRTGDTAASYNGKASTRDLPVTYRTIEYYPAETKSPSEKTRESGDLQKELNLKPCSRPLVIRKSGGVIQAAATKKVTPAYPPAALAQRISGSVLVEIMIDELGKVISTRSISGPAELRGAAEDAAKAWEFPPTYLTKMPVKVIGTITFNFNR